MTYVRPNYRTKRELIEAVGEGVQIAVYEPGLGSVPENGTVYLEGPHYPEPHRWSAQGTMRDGRLVSVK